MDSNKFCKLIVTSDESGIIRLWNLDKKFMREIQFPTPIDSVCFMNANGDILVSHVERISLIRFESYWNTTFTHFGITKPTDPVHLKYKEEEATLESELLDDFVLEATPALRIPTSNEEFETILKGRQDLEEEEKLDTNTIKLNDSISQVSSKFVFDSNRISQKIQKLSLKDVMSRVSEMQEQSSIG